RHRMRGGSYVQPVGSGVAEVGHDRDGRRFIGMDEIEIIQEQLNAAREATPGSPCRSGKKTVVLFVLWSVVNEEEVGVHRAQKLEGGAHSRSGVQRGFGKREGHGPPRAPVEAMGREISVDAAAGGIVGRAPRKCAVR